MTVPESIVVATGPNGHAVRAFTTWEKAQAWKDHWAEHGAGDEYLLTEVLVDDMPPEEGDDE